MNRRARIVKRISGRRGKFYRENMKEIKDELMTVAIEARFRANS